MSNAPAASPADTQPRAQKGLVLKLSILLILQLALANFLKFSETKFQPIEPTAQLINCDFAKIDKVVIEENPRDGKSTAKCVIVKDAGGWLLPEFHKLRARPDGLTQFFELLKGMKKGIPVATTTDATERFKLTPTNCVRSVTLYEGAKEAAVLYIGSSPTFKQVYAKVPSSKDIYTLDITPYQISGQPSDWLDSTILFLDPGTIAQIELNGFKLERDPAMASKWNIVTPDKTQPIGYRTAQGVAEAIARCSIISVLGTKDEPAFNMTQPNCIYTVKLKDGTSFTDKIAKRKDKNQYVLKRSNRDLFFESDEFYMARIKDNTLASLLKSSEKESKEKAKPTGPTLPGALAPAPVNTAAGQAPQSTAPAGGTATTPPATKP